MIVRSFCIVVLATIFRLTFALNRGDECTTPNNEKATCIAIQDCAVIYKELSINRNSSIVEFVKKSQCGHDSKPLVCCGKSAYYNTVPDILAFTNRLVCGLEKERQKVLGGEITDFYEFPWMVALEYMSKITGDSVGIRCGGSIINNRFIMTAARCIIHNEFKLTLVWLGEWRFSTDPDCSNVTHCADSIVKLGIKEEIPHPFYNERLHSNNIGLLRLEKDIQYTDYIRPICLPPENLPAPDVMTSMTIAGWGVYKNGPTSDIKLKVDVPVLSNQECYSRLQIILYVGHQLCVGDAEGIDSCKGDSGGPVIRPFQYGFTTQPQWYQEGVVSWGVECGYPAVYTRVSRYISWITNNTSED